MKIKIKLNKKTICSFIFAVILLGYLTEWGNAFRSVSEPSKQDSIIIEEQDFYVNFIDVGQADAILIRNGEEFMMIDAGNNDDGNFLVDYLDNAGVDSLKYFIGTHPHEDHIGGADNIIDNYNIENILLPDKVATTKTYKDMLQSISNANLEITVPEVGDIYWLGNDFFEVYSPAKEYSDTNNYSIVIKYTHVTSERNFTFLFMGDAEVEVEKDILRDFEVSVDVLKLGHHGSSTSSSIDFLKAANPQYAIIMSGEDNKYGHPHEEVIERLDNLKVDYWNTATKGHLLITIQSGSIVVESEK